MVGLDTLAIVAAILGFIQPLIAAIVILIA